MKGGRHAPLPIHVALTPRVSPLSAKHNRQNWWAFWSELVVLFRTLSMEDTVTLWAPYHETQMSVDTSGAEVVVSWTYHTQIALARWQLACSVFFFLER